MLALLAAAAVLPLGAQASEPLVTELEQRLVAEGVEGVNSYLSANGAAHMAALSRSTVACHLEAVSLSIQLARGNSSKVVEAHRESVRAAAGSCTRFVLALLSVKEIPKFCASVSSWTVSQMARELRRRMKRIEADELLLASPRGKACRAAYLYELQNTRVGLRVGPASPAPQPR
ncbi:MAG: hypothetical protein H7Y33_14845 [Cytophagales bacterium]|nr:hypothetical protein [Rhizobacter sp.]